MLDARTVYHFTHINNLPSIIKHGLLADAENPSYTCVGDTSIKSSRMRKPCPIPQDSAATVGNFVPFYFAPRSPMLNKISHGNVAGYTEGQAPLIYLVSTDTRLLEHCLCCATNQNAATNLAIFFVHTLEYRKAIDWELMRATWWNDTQDDPNRKARRMAEFLVYKNVPLHLITEIGVISQTRQREVACILRQTRADIPVTVQRHWYYD